MLRGISKILGKEEKNIIDKSVLGLFALMMKPRVVLDIPSYWQEVINTQLLSLSLTRSFKFPSLIIYLFLYQNVEEFLHLGLNIMDINKKRQSTVFWTNILREEKNEEGSFDFENHLMSTTYKIVNGVSP